MKRKITCLSIIAVLLLASCGKKDSAEDNITNNSASSITTQEVVSNDVSENNIEQTDVSANATPAEVILTNESNELLGKLTISSGERTRQHYLLNDSYNTIHFTLKAYKDSTTPISLYVNDELITIPDEMPTIEAGQTYDYEIRRKVSNYNPISAYYEVDGIKSNTATIYTYDRYTPDKAQESLKKIESLEVLNKSLMKDGYISDDNIEKALSNIEKAASVLKDKGDILDIDKGDDNVYIRFKSGIEYIYMPPTQGVKASGDEISIYTYQPFADPNVENALPTEELDQLAEFIDESFEKIEYSHDINDEIIDMDYIIENFSNNQIIIWDGHGGYNEHIGAFLVTGDTLQANLKEYGPGKGWLITDGGRFAVGADFFDMWFDNGSLDNSFIVLSACKSGVEDESHSLLQTLNDKGAEVVIGFTDSVLIDYANNYVTEVLKKMCTIDESTSDYYTSYDACNYGIKICGKDDGDDTPAAPIYCGEYDYRFSTAIEKAEEMKNAPIPDGVYDTALGVYGKNQDATFELYGYVTGNLKNARIDSTSNTLIVEAGFMHDEDSSIIIPYEIYELPLSPDYRLEAGTGDGPMDFSVESFNSLFYDNSMIAGYEGFGFSIWVNNGTVNRMLCWGS